MQKFKRFSVGSPLFPVSRFILNPVRCFHFSFLCGWPIQKFKRFWDVENSKAHYEVVRTLDYMTGMYGVPKSKELASVRCVCVYLCMRARQWG